MPDNIVIDSRLKDCRGPVEITLNFNKLLEIIDALETRLAALEPAP